MNERIERELELERLAVRMAAERIEEDVDRNGLTGTAGGKALIKRAVGEAEAAFETAIKGWIETESVKKRRSSAYKFLTVLDTRSLTYLTSRMVINALAHTTVDYRALVTALAREVLIATGAELFRQKDQKAFDSLTRKLNWQSRTYIRERIAQETFRNECIEVDATDLERAAIGATLVETFCTSTGLFSIETRFVSAAHSVKELTPTAKGQSWLNDAMEANRVACPYRLPMVVEPFPWTGLNEGGYYLQDLHPVELVRTKTGTPHKLVREADLSRVMDAVNRIQNTGWTLNKPVLDVWRQLLGTGLAGCSSKEAVVIPEAVAPEHPDFELVNASRREAFEEMKANTARRCVELQKLKMANIFENDPVFYFPHNLDFRGRIYPLAGLGAINPQGDDSGKALLKFAEGKRLGEEGVAWLFIHAQNVWGNDKVSLQQRIEATEANLDLYCLYALDPLNNIGWMEADKPFSFLAVCFELLDYSLVGEDFVSHLPVALDGSCSGLQHFAGIMKDQRTAEAVNVVQTGTERSSDIYSKVAEGVSALVAARSDEFASYWDGKVERDIVKQPVMTLSYGVTASGMREQIREKSRKLVRKGKADYKEGTHPQVAGYLADCITTVIGDVAGAAFSVMGWLGDVAMAKAKLVPTLDGALDWVTPMGLPVVQEYYEYDTKNVEVFTEGRRIQFAMRQGPACVKPSKQKQGAAPNFVHSMDASHLMLTVLASAENGIKDFAMIHDSFGTHAADTGTLFVVLRQEFAKMYEQDVLHALYDRLPQVVKDAVPPPPARGGLDLNRVLDSEFFFA